MTLPVSWYVMNPATVCSALSRASNRSRSGASATSIDIRSS
ncbi:hypothetical protein ACFQZ4_11260 [Catellatospora coxensis]